MPRKSSGPAESKATYGFSAKSSMETPTTSFRLIAARGRRLGVEGRPHIYTAATSRVTGGKECKPPTTQWGGCEGRELYRPQHYACMHACIAS